MGEFFNPCTQAQFNTIFLNSSKRGNETWQLVLYSDAKVVLHPDSRKPLRLWVSDGCWAALNMIEWALMSTHQFDPAHKKEFEDSLVNNRSITFFIENEVIVDWTIVDNPS